MHQREELGLAPAVIAAAVMFELTVAMSRDAAMSHAAALASVVA